MIESQTFDSSNPRRQRWSSRNLHKQDTTVASLAWSRRNSSHSECDLPASERQQILSGRIARASTVGTWKVSYQLHADVLDDDVIPRPKMWTKLTQGEYRVLVCGHHADLVPWRGSVLKSQQSEGWVESKCCRRSVQCSPGRNLRILASKVFRESLAVRCWLSLCYLHSASSFRTAAVASPSFAQITLPLCR
jgi:hypothetical protein